VWVELNDCHLLLSLEETILIADMKTLYEEIWREKVYNILKKPSSVRCDVYDEWRVNCMCYRFFQFFFLLSCINLLSIIELLRNMLFTSLIAGECMMYIKERSIADLLYASNTREIPFRKKNQQVLLDNHLIPVLMSFKSYCYR